MIGRIAYLIRSRFQHGVSVAWYRDIVRKQILSTDPVVADDSSVAEIHVMTSSSDWLNLIWTLKSFYSLSPRPYGLVIHNDGTLTDAIRQIFRHHFPACRMIDREESDNEVADLLKAFPLSNEFRRTNHLSPKLFDFAHHLRADRMILLDSDVLFFETPSELIRRIEDSTYELNSVNGDTSSAYTVDPSVVKEQCGVTVVPRFNSGLGLIHKDSIQLDWIEEFLGLPEILSHSWRVEQTLYALCSSRFGAELLPSEYDVFLDGQVGDRPSRHYVGAIRHLMYSEGMRKIRMRVVREQPWRAPNNNSL